MAPDKGGIESRSAKWQLSPKAMIPAAMPQNRLAKGHWKRGHWKRGKSGIGQHRYEEFTLGRDYSRKIASKNDQTAWAVPLGQFHCRVSERFWLDLIVTLCRAMIDLLYAC